jgi:amidohydrolase
MEINARIAKIVEQHRQALVALRRQLHQHPELAFEEHETAKAIRGYLDKLGPTVGLRADMDALPIEERSGVPFASKLPGKMHACGHDVHTVIALGVAAVLTQLKAELLSGAQAMIADGALRDPQMDVVLGYHNWPSVEAGKVGYHTDVVMASADAFDITLKGREAHGAHPHTGIDALAAAAHLVSQLQTIVSRE